MADYYQLLGVTPQASAGEIRQAYAKLARDKHPDRFTDPAAKQQAQRAFQDLTTAFNALANPKSRQEYDQAREKPVPKHARGDRDRRLRALAGGARGGPAAGCGHAAVHGGSQRPEPAGLPAGARSRAREGGGADAAREAVQVLERVTQLAPNHATAFVELATVLARQGLQAARAEGGGSGAADRAARRPRQPSSRPSWAWGSGERRADQRATR